MLMKTDQQNVIDVGLHRNKGYGNIQTDNLATSVMIKQTK